MTANDFFSISGKKVLITGGTAGIGHGVASHFVKSGAEVVITGRRETGEEIANAIGANFVRMDVSDAASVAGAMREAAEILGGTIDVLVLNAGTSPPSHGIDELKLQDLNQIFDVNVFGIVYGMQEGQKYMKEGGSVIVTSSPAGTMHMHGLSIYGSSKAAVNALIRTWTIELGSRGIRVNGVLPGVVETEMAFDPENLEAEMEMLGTFTATGKTRTPEELAPVYRFLASSASKTVSGAIIECDDGASAGYSNFLLGKAFG
ncbi:MAG: SDR family NAD(P)-dependent oxidoreductase [Gammaproteobacteria bacterium]